MRPTRSPSLTQLRSVSLARRRVSFRAVAAAATATTATAAAAGCCCCCCCRCRFHRCCGRRVGLQRIRAFLDPHRANGDAEPMGCRKAPRGRELARGPSSLRYGGSGGGGGRVLASPLSLSSFSPSGLFLPCRLLHAFTGELPPSSHASSSDIPDTLPPTDSATRGRVHLRGATAIPKPLS